MDWTLTASGAPCPLDLDEVQRALALLADPTLQVALCGLPSGRLRLARGDDPEACLRAAMELADDQNLYYHVCPLPLEYRGEGGLDRIKNADPAKRRWLFIDVDSVHPKESCATDQEKEYAAAAAREILGFLASEGWPEPLLVDSGNGYHLLYRVDLPNSEHGRALVRGCLHALAARFDTDNAHVGKECHDARRIAKLPGSTARKGENIPDRPHRPCRLLAAPDAPELVSAEQLAKLAAEAGKQGQPPPPRPVMAHELYGDRWTFQAGGSARWDLMARRELTRAVQEVALATPHSKDGRNNTLNRAAFWMGRLAGAGLIARGVVEEALRQAALACGLDTDPNCGVHGIEATIRSGFEAGLATPWSPPVASPPPPPSGGHHEGNGKPKKRLTIKASEITPRQVEWLWPERIPLGKLTTFAGQGGLGKTFVLCDISARVSRGLDWPDSQGECQKPGKVLFVSGEDEPDDTLVPRLIELGADLNNVHFLTTEVQDRFTLADLKTLSDALEEMGPEVRFVAIDPPTAYLGGIDDHKNAELRQLLSPLKTWTAKWHLAMVFNTHVTKPQGQKVEAMMRVMGSVAWVNAVRAAHIFARDPDDHTQQRVLYAPMKMNLARRRKALAYRIVPPEQAAGMARLEWLGEVDITADDAVNNTRGPSRKQVASEWLIERFRERLEWPSDQLISAARACGISRDALFEAKNILLLPKARQVVHENGTREWVWWVPPDWPAFKADRAGKQQDKPTELPS